MGRIVQRRTIAAGQLLLDLLVGARCPGCGGAGGRAPCSACLDALAASPPAADAAWMGSGIARSLVLAAKFGRWRGGAAWLGDRVVERCAVEGVQAVTWVPADRARRARRGGCLPERCARRIARRLEVPPVALLERIAGSSQRGLDRRARHANVARAYRVHPRPATSLPRGSCVLLLDDVRTTGATLSTIRRQLELTGLEVRTVALLAVGAAGSTDGRGQALVSTWTGRTHETPQRARNSRSRRGPLLPIRWHHVRRKGSTRT